MVTSVSASAQKRAGRRTTLALCLLPFGLFFFRRPRSTLAVALFAAMTLFASGCGRGPGVVNNAHPSLRHTPPGTYQDQVTASSTTGVQLSQIVTLNLTLAARQ